MRTTQISLTPDFVINSAGERKAAVRFGHFDGQVLKLRKIGLDSDLNDDLAKLDSETQDRLVEGWRQLKAVA